MNDNNKNIEDRKILQHYKPLVKFLSEQFGPSCEIVLHDVTTPKNSIIEIANGYHSGRKIGDSLTDLAKDIIDKKEYEIRDYMLHYSAVSNSKDFISSTYFIKNDNRLIGLLCINKDVATIKRFKKLFDQLQYQYNLISESQDETVIENLNKDVNFIINDLVSKTINEISSTPENLTQKEKIKIIHMLDSKGLMNMKGSIIEIAKLLDISVSSVYRYLKRKN